MNTTTRTKCPIKGHDGKHDFRYTFNESDNQSGNYSCECGMTRFYFESLDEVQNNPTVINGISFTECEME